jgi:hypothetical protein
MLFDRLRKKTIFTNHLVSSSEKKKKLKHFKYNFIIKKKRVKRPLNTDRFVRLKIIKYVQKKPLL